MPSVRLILTSLLSTVCAAEAETDFSVRLASTKAVNLQDQFAGIPDSVRQDKK